MTRPRVVATGVVALLSVLVNACGPSERVVYNELKSLSDGQFVAIKIEPGTYKVEITASHDGVSIRWEGASCPGSGETKNYSTTCEFKQTGQLIVENPTVLAMGAGTTATIKVTRISG